MSTDIRVGAGLAKKYIGYARMELQPNVSQSVVIKNIDDGLKMIQEVLSSFTEQRVLTGSIDADRIMLKCKCGAQFDSYYNFTLHASTCEQARDF